MYWSKNFKQDPFLELSFLRALRDLRVSAWKKPLTVEHVEITRSWRT